MAPSTLRGADVSAVGAGEILYSTGATAYDSLPAGSSGQLLQSNGAGAPSWISTSSVNFWARASGALTPLNPTDDVNLGSAATASAKISLAGSLTRGLAAVIINQTEVTDIFAASASGTSRFTIQNTGNLLATGTITGLTGITSSGTISFTGLSTNGPVYTSGGTGVLNSEAQLATARGGLGADVSAVGAGEILYSTGAPAYDSLPAGSFGQDQSGRLSDPGLGGRDHQPDRSHRYLRGFSLRYF